MTATHAAHIVTSEAEGLGDPEIIIMTRDEGFGAEEVERFGLGADATEDAALTLLRLVKGYRPVGEPTQAATGYVIVDVEKD